MFIYSNTQPNTFDPKSAVPYHEQNANRHYIRHYENFMFLKFILNHKDSTRNECTQATKELTICERKMNYWYKHPNYDQDVILPMITKIKRGWNNK